MQYLQLLYQSNQIGKIKTLNSPKNLRWGVIAPPAPSLYSLLMLSPIFFRHITESQTYANLSAYYGALLPIGYYYQFLTDNLRKLK